MSTKNEKHGAVVPVLAAGGFVLGGVALGLAIDAECKSNNALNELQTKTLKNLGRNSLVANADTLTLRGLEAGQGITLEVTTDNVVISADQGPSGSQGPTGTSGVNGVDGATGASGPGLANEGGGAEVFDQVVGNTANLRSLVGTSNGATVTQNSTTITVDNTLTGFNAGSSGSNTGQVFLSKTGSLLNFRSLTQGNAQSITTLGNDISLNPSLTSWRFWEELKSGDGAGDSVSGAQYRVFNTSVEAGPSTTNIALGVDTFSFTVQPGRYYVTASAPAYATGTHRCQLQDVLETVVLPGTNCTAAANLTTSNISSVMVISGVKVLNLVHFIKDAATNGLGIPVLWASHPEIYSVISFTLIG